MDWKKQTFCMNRGHLHISNESKGQHLQVVAKYARHGHESNETGDNHRLGDRDGQDLKTTRTREWERRGATCLLYKCHSFTAMSGIKYDPADRSPKLPFCYNITVRSIPQESASYGV